MKLKNKEFASTNVSTVYIAFESVKQYVEYLAKKNITEKDEKFVKKVAKRLSNFAGSLSAVQEKDLAAFVKSEKKNSDKAMAKSIFVAAVRSLKDEATNGFEDIAGAFVVEDVAENSAENSADEDAIYELNKQFDSKAFVTAQAYLRILNTADEAAKERISEQMNAALAEIEAERKTALSLTQPVFKAMSAEELLFEIKNTEVSRIALGKCKLATNLGRAAQKCLLEDITDPTKLIGNSEFSKEAIELNKLIAEMKYTTKIHAIGSVFLREYILQGESWEYQWNKNKKNASSKVRPDISAVFFNQAICGEVEATNRMQVGKLFELAKDFEYVQYYESKSKQLVIYDGKKLRKLAKRPFPVGVCVEVCRKALKKM